MSQLFEPLTLRSLTVRNRVWLAPMCQYSATDGVPDDWHLVHLGARATGGFGLILTEAAAVVPEGRISPQDAGIWNDEQAEAWRRIVDFVHGQGAAIGVQLAHAGRKASTYRPWAERVRLRARWPRAAGRRSAPSAVPFEGYAEPAALSTEEIAGVVTAFAEATTRAVEPGSTRSRSTRPTATCSTSSSRRCPTSATTTTAAPSRTASASSSRRSTPSARALPDTAPLLVRISGTDWIDGGWDLEQSTRLAVLLEERGVDLVDVSSGGNAPASIPVGPGLPGPAGRRSARGRPADRRGRPDHRAGAGREDPRQR